MRRLFVLREVMTIALLIFTVLALDALAVLVLAK
jgi:hypothetical protein